MITEAVKEEMRAVLAAIDASGMGAERKSTLRRIILMAEEGTNGLTPERKLQNVSETVFDLCLIHAFDWIDADGSGRGRAGLFDMLRDCKWAIVFLAAIVCGMLAFRPGTMAARHADADKQGGLRRPLPRNRPSNSAEPKMGG